MSNRKSRTKYIEPNFDTRRTKKQLVADHRLVIEDKDGTRRHVYKPDFVVFSIDWHDDRTFVVTVKDLLEQALHVGQY